ncbi:MAG: hypothetical protein ABEJ34_06785 [Haloferacaceae archaeon]
MIRVDEVPTDDEHVVVEANRRYALGADPADRRLIDVTGTKGTRAYGFYVDTDEQVVIDNVPQLVANGHLRPADAD